MKTSVTFQLIHVPTRACPCEVRFQDETYQIHYCKRHAAADDLINACQDAMEFVRDEHGNGPTARNLEKALIVAGVINPYEKQASGSKGGAL